MTIGNIDLGERPILLAPMEDVTDAGFRLLCRQLGADMVYTEFAAADAIVRMVPSTLAKRVIAPEERPAVVQIYGRDPHTMAQAAQIVAERIQPDILDINFGCPVKRVAGKGAGAGMLQHIPVEAVRPMPVTVKTRLGWDSSHIIIGELAPRLQDFGIQALTIHGRTRAQMYTGTADWAPIAAVKADPRIVIPIIANGDIDSPQRARDCFDQTAADAIMVGRATFGAPWIFAELKGRTLTVDDKLNLLRQQVTMSVERLGEYSGILHSRRHLAATPLFKGIANFRPLRISILRADTCASLFALIDEAAAIIPR